MRKKIDDAVKDAIRDSFKYDMEEGVYSDDFDGRCECIRELSNRFDVPFSAVERLVENVNIAVEELDTFDPAYSGMEVA